MSPAATMGVVSGFEKFFVNRSAEHNAGEIIELIEQSGVAIPAGAGILELGSGKGSVSYLMHQKFAPRRLVVTDYDPSQAVLAESYFRGKLGALPDGVEIRTADALDFPFGDMEFDVIFASHVLDHVEKHEWHFENIPRALGEISRVLKADGLFVFEEIFNKSRIQECLAGLGLYQVFEKKNWPGNRFCVYRKRQ
jgi:ubiquinone/menaquinone biosynthesis C-methylase UbiE